MSDEPMTMTNLLGAYWLDSEYWHPQPCSCFDRPRPDRTRVDARRPVRTALIVLACATIVAALTVTVGM
ncbi:hypothetical protein [Streptomyces sp. NPDC086787]|uniref:hypothetical protein n=1 Tax=Streptomyces sp. NPDC086787 TaxID=3365759 RepID=UPI00380CB8A8